MEVDLFDVFKWILGAIVLPAVFMFWKKLNEIQTSANHRERELVRLTTKLDAHEKHVKDKFDAMEKNHAESISQFYTVVAEIRDELRGLQSKVERGLQEASKQFIDLLKERK